jgi:hypothetical protein
MAKKSQVGAFGPRSQLLFRHPIASTPQKRRIKPNQTQSNLIKPNQTKNKIKNWTKEGESPIQPLESGNFCR